MRHMICSLVLVSTFWCALPTARAARETEPITAADRAAAKRAYQHAMTLYKAGKLRQAAVELRKAYTYAPLPPILFNLGVTYVKLGESDAARAALKEYVRALPNAPNRAEAEQMLAELDPSMGAVPAAARGGNADAKEAASDGPAADATQAHPGDRQLSQLGDDRENPLAHRTDGEVKTPYRFWKWTTALAAAGALTVGVLMYKQASEQQDALNRASTADPKVPYDTSVRAVEDSYRTNKMWGSVALISGGVLAATSVTLFLLDHRAGASGRAQLMPVIGQDTAGIAAAGAF